jgi:hypothetical protein
LSPSRKTILNRRYRDVTLGNPLKRARTLINDQFRNERNYRKRCARKEERWEDMDEREKDRCLRQIEEEVNGRRDEKLDRALRLWQSFSVTERRELEIDSGRQWWDSKSNLKRTSEWDNWESLCIEGNETQEPEDNDSDGSDDNTDSDESVDLAKSKVRMSNPFDEDDHEDQRFRDWISSGQASGRYEVNADEDIDEPLEWDSDEMF